MNKKIHVLQFVSDLGKNSGIAHVLMEYFKVINNDIIYDFVYFNEVDNSYKAEIKKLGGVFFKLPSPINLVKFNREWKKFCKDNYGKYDVFENNLPFLGVLFSSVKDRLGVKVDITHSHVTKFGDRKFSDFRNKLFFILTGQNVGDILFSCSSEAGKKIFGKKCQLKEWHIINNAFKIEKFAFNGKKRDAVRANMGWSNKKVIGNIGRLVPPKNQKLILEVFARLESDNCLLVIVGEGYLKEPLENEARRLKIEDKVEFLGTRNDISDLLQAFDAFYFPSIFEGLGVSLVEAQIAGLPALISNTIPTEAIISNCIIENLDSSIIDWERKLEQVLVMKREKNGVYLARSHGFDLDLESIKLIKLYQNILAR